MKNLSYSCKKMKTLTCLHKQGLCSGWQNSVLWYPQKLGTRNISSFYLHGNTRGHQSRSHQLNLNCIESQINKLFSQKTAGFHTLASICVLDIFNTKGIEDLYRRNTVIVTRGSSRSSRTIDEENEEKILHKYMMEKMSIENGMLSWFRNTYILTLVSLASMQLDTTPIPSVAGGIVITTAVMNLTVATGKYITTFLKLGRTNRLHGTPLEGHIVFSVIHYILLLCLYWAIFPGVNKIAEEWKAYRRKDT
ncbi:uncharacterized protein LOC132726614 isoform X2 [Ruditapes philippinarum]|nr:uncharacterized protein LOC132726614 isoform X2 [Ruditapes philippinarum]XP_060567940.1 uncharacterized protein LOC132726614 isoform X2 [Ruditapes philippinarum]XP_060567941.1 uncharacterized protein LOC132726614 isoform X2 [Ruditapes philippinarum]